MALHTYRRENEGMSEKEVQNDYALSPKFIRICCREPFDNAQKPSPATAELHNFVDDMA